VLLLAARRLGAAASRLGAAAVGPAAWVSDGGWLQRAARRWTWIGRRRKKVI